MNLWMAALLDGMECEWNLIEFTREIRAENTGTLVGRHKKEFAVFFKVNDDQMDVETISRLWKSFAGERFARACVVFKQLSPGDANGVAVYWGLKKEDVREMLREQNEPPTISPEKPGKSSITIEMRVDGVEDAINKLKVLEAQLHGAKMMVEKISTAIDGLQMQLENKIKSFERPDR